MAYIHFLSLNSKHHSLFTAISGIPSPPPPTPVFLFFSFNVDSKKYKSIKTHLIANVKLK